MTQSHFDRTIASDVVGETLGRPQLESMLKTAERPLIFERCDFSGADLSRLNLRGTEFRACLLLESSLYAARLGSSTWFRCRISKADLAFADVVDSRFVHCDLSNTN